jgi:hypothetical protein
MITRTKVETAIGKTYADSLDTTVFRVSMKFSYTKRELVDKVGCGNFVAATRLSKILRRLGILSPLKLYQIDPASLARTRGVGQACMFVAMCILESNEYDSMKWWARNKVKFNTLKHRSVQHHKQDVA